MDTVRADAVGSAGSIGVTPAIAAIAREGVRFRDFIAASNYTLPSHMTLFTGLDPAEHGVHRATTALNPEVRTLPELLGSAGYRTQAFHEGGYVAPRFGFDRGFEQYRGFEPLELVRKRAQVVMDWVREAAGQRYFLFLHTYHAHAPYGGYARYRSQDPERSLLSDARIAALRRSFSDAEPERSSVPPEDWAACSVYNLLAESWQDTLRCGDPDYTAYRESPHFAADRAAMRAGYLRRIGEIDAFVGQLRATLEELGQWDDTLLVITSDHGEAFFEHGGQLHDYLPWEEVLRVPLVLSYPNGLAAVAGREVRGLAGHADLMPTLLGLAGLAPPARGSGQDLSPVIFGAQELPADREHFPAILRSAHRPQEPLRRVVLRGSLQYIEGDVAFGDAEGLLLDRAAPNGSNLRAKRPAEVAALRAAIERHTAALDPVPPIDFRTGKPWADAAGPADGELDLRQREQLRGLGYLR